MISSSLIFRLLLLSLLVVSPFYRFVYAEACCLSSTQATYASSFYLGGGIGECFGAGHTSIDTTLGSDFASGSLPNYTRDICGGKPSAEMFVGYLAVGNGFLSCASFALATEFYFRYTNFNNTQKDLYQLSTSTRDIDFSQSSTLQFPWQLGVRIKPGLIVGANQDWFLYGLIGPEFGRAEWNFQVRNLTDSRLEDLHSAKKTLFGFSIGLGIEKAITKDMRIGIEVSHSFYSTFSDFQKDFEDDSYHSMATRPQFTVVNFRVSMPL